MKRFHILLLSSVAGLVIFSSCGKTTVPGTQDGNWYREVAPFQGPARSHAVSFVINQTQGGVTSSIGTTAYVGMGVDNYNTKYNDFYYCTPSTDSSVSWTQVVSCPGTGRTDAVGFSIGAEGYVGMGQDSALNVLNDFWQYDSASNTWTSINSFCPSLGPARYLAVGFGIQNYGYVGTGYDTRFYYGDFYRYDPSSNTWSTAPTFTGYKRAGAVSFVWDNTAYVVTGIGENGGVVNDFYRFSIMSIPADNYHPVAQQANTWLHLNSITNVSPATFDDGYTNIQRTAAVAFVMSGVTSGLGSPDNGRPKAFLTCGSAGSATWEYDILSDLWTSRTAFESPSVNYAVAFTIQNRGFVTTGATGSTGVSSTSEFFPDEVYNAQD